MEKLQHEIIIHSCLNSHPSYFKGTNKQNKSLIFNKMFKNSQDTTNIEEGGVGMMTGCVGSNDLINLALLLYT